MKKDLILVTVLAFLLASLMAMLTPYIPLYGEDIGFSVARIGYLVAIYHFAQFLGRVPMGTLSDVLGYKKIIASGGVAFLASSIFYIISPLWPPLLFLAQVFLGLTVCTEWVTIPAYISRFARDKIPVFTFIIGWAYTFAMPLGGFIKDTLGMDFLFYLALITSVITLFIIGLLWKVAPTQEEITENRLTSQSIISLYKESFETLRNPNIMRASLYSFLMFLNLNIALSLFPLRLSRLGFTAALIGLLQFARAGTNSSIRIFYDYIEKRIDRSNVLRIGAAVSGLALLFISVVESLPLLVLISVIWGLSSGLYAPVVYGMIADGTTVEDRGKGMGIRGMAGTLGSFLGIVIFSNIAELISIPLSIGLAGIAIILGILLIEFLFSKQYLVFK